jgi:hypothetical protein
VDPKKPGLIELQAGEDKWYAVKGTHPGTRKPYYWPQEIPHIDELPVVTAEKLDAFYDRLADELPRFKSSTSTHINRNDVDQESLKGDLERVRLAMANIPNRHEDIGYDEWVKIAAALRGACQDDFDLGLELFLEFSDRSDITNPTEDPERIYRTMLAPFGLGADFLYDKAYKLGGWQQRVTDLWWEPVPDYEPLFPEECNDNVAAADGDTYEVLRASEILKREPPKFLIARHIYPRCRLDSSIVNQAPARHSLRWTRLFILPVAFRIGMAIPSRPTEMLLCCTSLRRALSASGTVSRLGSNGTTWWMCQTGS